jgi:hypothetical protein
MRSTTLCFAIVAAVAASGTTVPAATATTKTIPKAQLVKRGDAICKRGNRGYTLSPPSGDPAHMTADQLRKALPFLRQDLRVTGSEVREVAALGTPDREAKTFRRAIARSQGLLKALRQEIAAVQAGDVPAFLAALQQEQNAGRAASRLLFRVGFRVCGQ